MLRGVAESAVAVAAVSAGIALLLAVRGQPAASTGAAPSGRAASHNVVAPPPSPAPTPLASTPPPVAARRPAPPPPVVVLNDSRIRGLAARAAGLLRAGGWPVAQIGNWAGRVPATTVYYAAGTADAARRLAARLPAVRRVAPRFPGLPGAPLVLVVTRDFPGSG